MTKPDPNDPLKDNYGDLELICSKFQTERQFLKIKELTEEHAGQEIWIRGRTHNVRAKGNCAFIVLRQNVYNIQLAAFLGETNSKMMMKYMKGISNESIIEAYAKVKKADRPIESCTCKNIELDILKIHVVNRSAQNLPLILADACAVYATLDEVQGMDETDVGEEKAEEAKEEKKGQGRKKKEEAKKEDARIKAGLATRFNNRVIDLRTPTSQALMRINSQVCALFRDYLLSQDFVEIHTPKLIPGTSEGGAEVFKINYFNRDACLAQSPQLYKQMAVMADLERVFEIAPVFRAEKSFTPRHMCEFVGLDLEMAINEHYFEVIKVINGLFYFIYKGLNERCQVEYETVRQQFPYIQPVVFTEEPVILDFCEGCDMLAEAGLTQDKHDDLGTDNERVLGELVKAKYGTDFYVLHRYPTEARPFYTMPCHDDPGYTCSFDAFIRGEEILSGAQRVHDPVLLEERIRSKDVDPDTLRSYINAFAYGATPHGGVGIGLERVVKLFAGIHNIKTVSMFPRDPKRIVP